jgi:hypothetical protein
VAVIDIFNCENEKSKNKHHCASNQLKRGEKKERNQNIVKQQEPLSFEEGGKILFRDENTLKYQLLQIRERFDFFFKFLFSFLFPVFKRNYDIVLHLKSPLQVA